MSLKSLKKTVDLRPFKAIIYGTPKIGKSTLASNAPNPLFLNMEDGLDGIASTKYEPVEGRKVILNLHEFLQALHAVITEEHDFKTLAIDSLSTLERLIWNQICLENNVKTISDIKWGQGYKLAGAYWDQIRSMLEVIRNKRNMILILIGHHEVKKYLDPMSDPYDRYNIKLHEDQRAIFTEWADMILFADQETHTTSQDIGFNRKINTAFGGNRVLYTIEDPKYVAGNRYGLPAKIALDWPVFWNTFMHCATAKASQEASERANEVQAPEAALTVPLTEEVNVTGGFYEGNSNLAPEPEPDITSG